MKCHEQFRIIFVFLITTPEMRKVNQQRYRSANDQHKYMKTKRKDTTCVIIDHWYEFGELFFMFSIRNHYIYNVHFDDSLFRYKICGSIIVIVDGKYWIEDALIFYSCSRFHSIADCLLSMCETCIDNNKKCMLYALNINKLNRTVLIS